MKASQLAKELQHIIDIKGDLDCTISCSLSTEGLAKLTELKQSYIITTPGFVVVEGANPSEPGQKEEIMIRDWPY